jgi:hypothetical protein
MLQDNVRDWDVEQDFRIRSLNIEFLCTKFFLLYGKHHFRWNGGLWLAEKHFQLSIIFP